MKSKKPEDEPVQSVPFPNTEFYDKRLTKLRLNEIDELVTTMGLNCGDFRWHEDVSSKFQRPDVIRSQLGSTPNLVVAAVAGREDL